MRLHVARLYLDCQEIHAAQRCPACSSETFAPVSRWIPAQERRERRDCRRAKTSRRPTAGCLSRTPTSSVPLCGRSALHSWSRPPALVDGCGNVRNAVRTTDRTTRSGGSCQAKLKSPRDPCSSCGQRWRRVRVGSAAAVFRSRSDAAPLQPEPAARSVTPLFPAPLGSFRRLCPCLIELNHPSMRQIQVIAIRNVHPGLAGEHALIPLEQEWFGLVVFLPAARLAPTRLSARNRCQPSGCALASAAIAARASVSLSANFPCDRYASARSGAEGIESG